jgi:hypothetical protein
MIMPIVSGMIFTVFLVVKLVNLRQETLFSRFDWPQAILLVFAYILVITLIVVTVHSNYTRYYEVPRLVVDPPVHWYKGTK